MSTAIRPEISSKSKYWISKHRYYELRHFCLQYKEWKEAYTDLLNGCIPMSNICDNYIHSNKKLDRTAEIAMMRQDVATRMDLVSRTAEECDKELSHYIFIAVTEDRPYSYLRTVLEMPCGKDMFYDRYRKFFYLLSKLR